MGLIKARIFENKRNGQITAYFKKKELSPSIIKAVKEQPKALKRILMDIKGVERD